jgi:hypothetical protein
LKLVDEEKQKVAPETAPSSSARTQASWVHWFTLVVILNIFISSLFCNKLCWLCCQYSTFLT